MRGRLQAKSVRRAAATALLAAVLWVPAARADMGCDEICDIPYPHVVEHCTVDCGWIRCDYDYDRVRGYVTSISCDDE